MKYLKLPISAKFPAKHKWLSMDEYIKFVNFSFKNRVRKDLKSNELNMRVNAPFYLQ
jgi:hypothetical protein